MIENLSETGRVVATGAPEGYDALVLCDQSHKRRVLHVCRDDSRMASLSAAVRFFAPNLDVLEFPAWDCLPYDRVSPNPEIVARRLDALGRLSVSAETGLVLTTVSAVLQRVPAHELFEKGGLAATVGDSISQAEFSTYFQRNGYRRAATVREPGEFAFRGGIIDVYSPGSEQPYRLDFFGDELESIRSFDPMTQRTASTTESFVLGPVSEIAFDSESMERFREGYRLQFGPPVGSDPLYEAVSAGAHHPGVEHWLPLFNITLETLFDYVPNSLITLDHEAEQAIDARFELIADFYEARREMMPATVRDANDDVPPYKPLPPDLLYMSEEEWAKAVDARPVFAFFPLAAGPQGETTIDLGGRRTGDFTEARHRPDVNLFDVFRDRVSGEKERKVVVFAYSNGSRDRLSGLLKDHGVSRVDVIETWEELTERQIGSVSIAALDIARGFSTPDILAFSEQDILGERMARPSRRRRRAEEFISEASSLADGDLIVHIDHGVGRFVRLETLDVDGRQHDCLTVEYNGGDRLYVPVENIDVLSRFGSEESAGQLDRLGGAAWQARKARVKERIRIIAESLLKTAAERELKRTEATDLPEDGSFQEFCAEFAWTETDDQMSAIEDVIGDLGSGRPMDRLICGDVGFGKTEVALRAAFVAAISGKQVAMVVPTTLLARQHFATVVERFKGLPLKLGQMSRMVSGKQAQAVRDGIESGEIDIVVGTHALLGKSIKFNNLGLLIIDEEQHFGVGQKERLKQLRADVHVLTLTATPIPRTLQMALAGVREMSIIATPPVDRLAVRTFVLPYDPVVMREAIQRERFRGGQVFYVCPRIADLDHVHRRLTELVPDAKMAVAHGQMPTAELEEVMSGFVEGRFDILLSTHIVEAGLDIPKANTIIVHRADRFGLSQLYQLRGRVGRSKTRAYAYLTLPPGQTVTPTAMRRLEVMQALDTLGAGFSLASHDLDIRGAGNLLGDEQSGHIREVGVELYQHMLEETIATLRETGGASEEEAWTPQISLGTSVLIPEKYVADLSVRLGLYRRLSMLIGQAEIEAFAAEMIDRFGPLPQEVENLLEVMAVKQLCRIAGVETVDAGPKGAVLSFHNNTPPSPERLIGYIQTKFRTIKLRPDQKLVYLQDWASPGVRVKGAHSLLSDLAGLVEG